MRKLLFTMITGLLLLAFTGSASALLLYSNNFETEKMNVWVSASTAGGSEVNVNDNPPNLPETIMKKDYLLLTKTDNNFSLTLHGVEWVQRVRFSYEAFGTWDTSGRLQDYFDFAIDDGAGDIFDKEFFLGQGDGATRQKFKIKKNVSGDLVLNWDIDVTGSDEMLGLDHIAVFGQPVPEPATMMLFGFGLLGLAGISRRKK